MKKRYGLNLAQLIFLIICASLISILAFLLGIEVGKFLKSSEAHLKATSMNDIKPSVTISLENYSTVIRQRYEKVPESSGKSEEIKKQTDKATKLVKPEIAAQDKSSEVTLIQVGAYKEKSSSIGVEKRLKSLGFKTKIVEGKLTKLMVVLESDKEKPEEVIERLEKEGIKGIIVKK